jgi:hypothetical protein
MTWGGSAKNSPDGYGVSCCLAAQKDSQLSNGFVYIDQFLARRTFLEKQANPTDDFRCPCYVFHNSQHSLACLFQIGVIALEPPQAGFGIDERGGNRLIDRVCKRSGQLSHRGHSADAFEIRLRLAKGLFGIDRLSSSSFGRRRKMTGDQRYRQKTESCNPILWIGDRESKDWRNKEEIKS